LYRRFLLSFLLGPPPRPHQQCTIGPCFSCHLYRLFVLKRSLQFCGICFVLLLFELLWAI
jgi:hypothetical protein